MSEIRAKIAAIVSEHQLALNAGAEAGVELDDEVHVIREVDVDDPDSKERLGTIRLIRLRLKVIYLQEKLSVAIVTDMHSATDSGGGSFANLVTPRRLKKVTSTTQLGQEYVQIKLGETVVIKKKSPATSEDSGD